jgi:predicted N-acyltransferase
LLRAALIKILMHTAQRKDQKSVFNILHIDKPSATEYESHGAMLAIERHSMWFNQGFSSLEVYLEGQTKHTRENFRRDRRLAQSHGLEFKTLHGHELSAEVLADYYEGHRRVCERYAMRPWLPATAYVAIAQALPKAAMLMGYFNSGRLVAGILYLMGRAEQTLYALQWSEMEKLEGVAMDLICHRPIDHAIEHAIAKLDSGLAAPHKQHRGWQTVPVYHAHWFYTEELKALAKLQSG